MPDTLQLIQTLDQKITELSARQDEAYLRFRDALTKLDALTTRVDVLDYFIKKQFPEHFAGEAETVPDDDLNPIPIIYGEPEESDPTKWKEGENVKRRVQTRAGQIRDADGNYE